MPSVWRWPSECEVQRTSIFARKNYFYPDLPKGYQISQYESPLAVNGKLTVRTADGEQIVRVRRVHLEEDTGKLTHVERDGKSYSLVDLNRAGVPLLEVVSEPDIHSAEAARLYGEALRDVLRYLGVNSGDMEKGVMRFEANVSVRPVTAPGTDPAPLGTRTEVKNLNSFRAMERAILYEIERQSKILADGGQVEQETLGWSEARGQTYSQRSKEEAHDYRYFPEPDLPPLVVEPDWVAARRCRTARAAVRQVPALHEPVRAQQLQRLAPDRRTGRRGLLRTGGRVGLAASCRQLDPGRSVFADPPIRCRRRTSPRASAA